MMKKAKVWKGDFIVFPLRFISMQCQMEKDNLQNTNTTNNLIFTNIFNFRDCSDAKGCQMTSSIEPLLVMPSTSPSSHTNMASSDISTTSATPPSHLAILSIKGFVVPSDNYSDINRQALASEPLIKIVCFIINHIQHIVWDKICLGYILVLVKKILSHFLSDPGVPGVRSMGPVVSHKLSYLVQTKLMWLWVMKIRTQY